MSWTIKTVNECWKCKHLQKSIYMESERETLYNCWCEVGEMESKEKCNKFKLCDEIKFLFNGGKYENRKFKMYKRY